MAAAAAAACGTELGGSLSARTGVHRCYEIEYPAAHHVPDGMRDNVLLEMGVRGGPEPSDRVSVTCLLGDALGDAGVNLADFEDLASFEIDVLHPGRTLLEKLVLIESRARILNENPAGWKPRDGRHFYDVYELLGDAQVLDFLNDPERVRKTLDSIAQVSQEYFNGSGKARPDDGFASSPAFDPASTESQHMKSAYDAGMRELYFGAELPTWQQICSRVTALRDLL